MTHRPQDRVATLDLLRLASALAVVAFHYLFRGSVADDGPQLAYPEAAGWAIYGYLGLNLFFMISGFVIAWSAEGRDWATFAVARFARLYPGFIACMTITFVVVGLAGMEPFRANWAQWLANLTMVAPALGQPFMDGVYWTIVLEMIFYFWVAVALLFGVFDRRRLLLVAIWLAVSALNEHLVDSGALRMALVSQYAPYFAFGVVLQHMVAHGRSRAGMLLALVAFALSFPSLLDMRHWMLEHYAVAPSVEALLVANCAIHLMFLGAVALRNRLAPTPMVAMLGGLTYPLYLVHQNAGIVVLNHLAPEIGRWPALAVVFCLVLAVSWLVWRHVEMPSRRAISAALRPIAEMAAGLVTRTHIAAMQGAGPR